MSWLDSVFKFIPHGFYNALAQQAQNGQMVPLQTNDRGHLLVDNAGGNSAWQDTSPPAAERVVKNTTALFYSAVFTNTGATDVWVFLFNHALAGDGQRPANGGVPLFIPFKVAAGTEKAVTLNRPRRFSSGIYWGASSTKTTFTFDATATVMAAAEYG